MTYTLLTGLFWFKKEIIVFEDTTKDMTSKILHQRDPITGQLFYFDEESGKASWTDPSVLKRNKRLSMKGKILFRRSAKQEIDGKHGGISMSFDFTKKEPKKRTVDMWEFTPTPSEGLKSAPNLLRSGMKDPMKFTDVDRQVAPGKFKPKQVFCYSCGREFGTRSLKIHWKSCVEKRRVEMSRRPSRLRRSLSRPPNELLFPFPKISSGEEVFKKYNMEALRIYGNQFGVFICWQCKRQFTSEKAHLAHLREHDELRELEELERTRRKKEEEEKAELAEINRRRKMEEELERTRRKKEEEAERKRREHAERKERRRKVFIYDEDISQRIGEVFVSGLTTIGQLKHVCGIDRIRILAFQGRALDDEEIVHDAGLRDNNEIHILISDEERKRRDLEKHEAMRRAQADMCRLETEQGMRYAI